MNVDNKTVTEKIFELLEEHGMSQRELALRTGISTSAISDWKHKGAVPSVDKVQKICEVLHVSPNRIFDVERSAKTTDYYVDDVELKYFVELYRQIDNDEGKRILAYATEMLKMVRRME